MPLFWTNACHLSSQKEIIVITENAGTACTSFGTRRILFIQTKNNVFDLIRVPRGVGGVLRHCWKWSIDAVVEIGAIGNIGVQLDASYGLLVNLLPNRPSDVERRPAKRRKAPRDKTVAP
jgi:hypothetical protein